MKLDSVINVAIVCSGSDGVDIVSTLIDCPSINIAGICGVDSSSIDMLSSKQFDVPLFEHMNALNSVGDIDVIINTSDKTIDGLDLLESTEMLHGKGAGIIKSLTTDYAFLNSNLKTILDSGMALSSQKDSKGVYGSILEYATKITGYPAGSLIVFNEKTEVCRLVEVAGYADKFTGEYSWELRLGEFSESLLDSKEPIFFPDINDGAAFDNPVMKEGTVSVLATALRENDSVIGLLFVGDFKKRVFNEREIALFSSFSGQAALALQKALLIEKNEELTVIDSLSGLFNPRHFFETLDAEVRRIQRYGGSFSVLGMDIDNLGYINNSFGHSKGDWAVKKVSDIIVACARQTDYKARYGGDEFALILPSTTYQQASVLANRIRRQVNEILISDSEEQIRLSVSIGIAEFPSLGPDSTNLLTAVNTALAVCKQRGRNLVCCYEETDYATDQST
jgi:diguanylate cyclase (GGDEF)-like protein